MKKYLLPESGKFYKANLHCHSTFSDGHKTPEEIKQMYMEKGYSIVAYTDHNLMIPHTELKSDEFLPLTSFEIDMSEPKDGRALRKTCHICVIAPTETGTCQVGYHRTRHTSEKQAPFRSLVEVDESRPDFVREFSHERINQFTKEAQEMGYFVTYNHPTWSNENYEDYIGYKNLDAMEICNFASIVEGYEDYNPRVYDDLLRSGQRIYCVATDDNHNKYEDSFGGFTCIKADKLDYPSVFKALKDGNFYASQGPEIYDLWLDEDNTVHIKCSPVDRITFNTGIRSAGIAKAEEGKTITEASFKVEPDQRYFRLTVIDERGYPANTNAYFTDEWLFG